MEIGDSNYQLKPGGMMSESMKHFADASAIAHEFTKERDYWLNKLSGEPVKSSFPYNSKKRAANQGGANTPGTVKFKLKGELFSKLMKVSNGSDARLHMILVAGVVVLLNKYTGHRDIIVGAPIYHQDTEGELINTVLALKNRIEDTMTFKNLLLGINRTIWEAVENQNYPFEALLYQLNMNVSKNGSPLFDSAILLENIHDKEYLRHIHLNTVFVFKRTGKSIESVIEYNSLLYDKVTAARIIRHFLNALNDGVSNVNKKISNLDILSGKEQEELIYEFNKTEAEYPRNKTIHTLFADQAAKTPDCVALTGTGPGPASTKASLSFEELNSKANQLAQLLAGKGVTGDKIIGIMVDRSIDMIVGILGILKAGGAYLPIDPDYPGERINYMLADSSANVLVTTSSPYERRKIGGREHDMNLEIIFPNASNPPGFPASPLPCFPASHPSNLAYVIYTSGTTGQPKGAMIDHRNVVRLLFNDKSLFEFNSHDTWTMFHSCCFDFSVWEMYGALLYGGKLIVIPQKTARDPAEFLQVLKKENVTVLNQTPSAFYNLIAEELKFTAAELNIRYIIFGGEALKPARLKEWKTRYPGTKLINMYGITETTVHVTYKEIGHEEIEMNISNIGKPIPTLSTYVMDNNQKLLPKGVTGELCVGGEGVGRGYLGRVELTRVKFVENPFKSGEKLYKSGDLVRFLENGEMEYLGRIDQQVKIRGFRIELGEIETQLLACPGIKEVVVMDRQHDKENTGPGEHHNSYLCAYFVSYNETPLTASQLKGHLVRKLPDYMIPAYFVQLDEIPLTANGKIHKKALPPPRSVPGENYSPPRDQLEETLAQIWQKVLTVEKVGITDSFFDIGGDSIKVIKLLSLINSAVNIDLKIIDLYTHETIEKLAGIINRHETTAENEKLKKTLIEMEELKTRVLAQNKLPWDINEIEDIYPMSDIEKGMVFHYLKNPHQAVYHDQMIHQMKYKEFDPQRFKKALVLMVEKHSILRTSFNMEDFQEPIRIVHKRVGIDIKHVDISNMEKHQQEDNINQYLAEDRQNPFNTAVPPLWRMRTWDLGKENVVIAWIFHHAILDGWSDASFKTELNNIYLELQSNPAFIPKKLENDYKRFIIEQAAQKKKNQTIDYWKNELDNYKRLKFPAKEKKENNHETPGKKMFMRDLGLPTLQRLTGVAKKYGTSIKNLCLGAYIYMLSMISHENDMVIGLVTNNRPICKDGEKILGCFLNTVPFRIQIPANLSWSDFARLINKKCIELSQYDRLSLLEIVEIIGERPREQNPIFDTLYNYLDYHVYDQGIQFNLPKHGQDNEKLLFIQRVMSTNTPFDFTINTSFGGFLLHLSYDGSLLSNQGVEKLCSYFKRVLNKFINAPQSLMRKDEIITPEEKRMILYDFNDTKAGYPKENLIQEIFEEQVEKTPGNIAVVFNDRQLTYKELDEKTNQLAGQLKRRGIKPEAIAAVMTERSIQMIIGILGILKAGGAYLPLNPEDPRQRIDYMLADSGCNLLLTQKKFIDIGASAVGTPEIIVLEDAVLYAGDYKKPGKTNSPGDSGPLAYVMYTSGSTGRAKGILVTHNNVNRLVINTNYIEFTAGTRILQTGAPVFDATTFELWGSLLNGGRLHLVKKEVILDAHRLKKTLLKHSITTLWLSSPLFDQLVQQCSDMFLTLRYLIVGGDVLSPRYINIVRGKNKELKVVNGYGPTENTTFSTTYSIETDFEDSIPIGKPISNSTAYILDSNNQLQPIGVSGELWLGGDGVSRGYLNSPDLTNEKYIPGTFLPGHSPGESKGMLYKTGDLARWLPDGNIEFLGRLDHQVKISGFRIELAEIECQLLKHPGINEVVVLPQKGEDRFLPAYIVANKELTSLELREYLSKRLPGYMIPSYFFFLDKIPLNANGKVDSSALHSYRRKPDTGDGCAAPGSEIEKVMASTWTAVLKLDKVGINDNFFDLGGNSLAIVRLNSELKRKLNIEIPVVKLFEYPTIRSLSRYLFPGEKYQNLPGIDEENNDNNLSEVGELVTETLQLFGEIEETV
jgi:surfactin family lipopeptide synthetase A